MSRGSKSTTKSVRPGIMPILFGRHLIDKAVFLSLNEVADNLPPLEEECIPVRDGRRTGQRPTRQEVEEPLAEAIKEMMKRKDRRLLGTMLQTLLAYPDYPFGWEPVGYWDAAKMAVPVRDGRHAAQSAGRRDPTEGTSPDRPGSCREGQRPEGLGLRAVHRQARCPGTAGQAASGRPGFGSVCCVQASRWPSAKSGSPSTLQGSTWSSATRGWWKPAWTCSTRAAGTTSRRSASTRRATTCSPCGRHHGGPGASGRRKPCRIVYFYYEGTMQDRAMALMGKKLTAAQALEGRFSSEGLVALAGEDANVEIALARSLVERMDEGDARRHWSRTLNVGMNVQTNTPAPSGHEGLWEDAVEPAAPMQPAPSSRRRRIRTSSRVHDSVRQFADLLF